MRSAGTRLASEFDWDTIASETAAVYARAMRRDLGELARPKIVTGNVLGG